MEACLGVEREVAKVLDKFTNLRDQNVRNIDELLTIVRNARTELQNGKCQKIRICINGIIGTCGQLCEISGLTV